MSTETPQERQSGTDGGGVVETADYEQMLETLDVAIDQARYKIENGRVRDEQKEKVRIKWVRALAYSVKVRGQIAKARDLEELAEQVEQLKAQQHQRGRL